MGERGQKYIKGSQIYVARKRITIETREVSNSEATTTKYAFRFCVMLQLLRFAAVLPFFLHRIDEVLARHD